MTDPSASMRVEDDKGEEGPVLRDSPFSEGTYHQSQLSQDGIKKGFFTRPDAALAEAVNKDADVVEFTLAEEVCRSYPM